MRTLFYTPLLPAFFTAALLSACGGDDTNDTSKTTSSDKANKNERPKL